MQQQYPHFVTLPTNLPDETAAEILEFLYDLTRTFENIYADQIRRHYRSKNDPPTNTPIDQDPPF